jgi:hypothetical protein
MDMTNWTPPGWRPERANRYTCAGLLIAAGICYQQDAPIVAACLAVLAVCVMIPALPDPNPPVRRSAYLGRIVCMECGDTIEPAIQPGLMDSHGLCTECRPAYMTIVDE